MKYSFVKLTASMLVALSVMFTACEDDDDKEPVTPLEAKIVSDLPADPDKNTSNETITTTGKFALFSFKTGATVANSDSATSNWDIGFRGTSIIVNGGTSGPGASAIQIVNGIFDEITTAPADGYITTVTGSDWYVYTGAAATGPQHAIFPIAGKVFVVKTADGKYAKLEVLSYYYGNPDTTTETFANLATRQPSRYYTFRYLYQADGTTNLAADEE